MGNRPKRYAQTNNKRLIVLVIIIYQDLSTREVYWFLFPMLALVLGSLFFLYCPEPMVMLYNSLLNGLLVSGILLTLFLFTKLVLKQKFLDHSFGLGDLFMFYAISVGFPSITFVILLVTCLVGSLGFYIVFKARTKDKSVPLAGLMGFCLLCILMASAVLPIPSLYFL